MLRITLNNGQSIDQLGLGVYKVNQDIAIDLVSTALDIGYRRIDTASLYDNEIEVGAAVRRSGIPRNEIFVTTKIWKDRHGYQSATEAIAESLERLNIDYVDMLLIHWPSPKLGLFVETWQALQDALASGSVRGIGVSNFNTSHLETLLAAETTKIVPALNQVELNPGFQQPELRAFDSAHGIATEAWAPLARGRMLESPVLTSIAAAHGKTVAQVMIRWHLQLGNLVIPKSSNPDRLEENFKVFDFELTDSEMVSIATLDTGVRNGADPEEM